jgi:TolA-binding protein
MRSADCLSDLVTRARRYRLSQAEQVRLADHLCVCAPCRREQQIGADFDAIGTLRPGDDRLIAELAQRTVERLSKRPEPRRRSRSLSIAAALACILFSAGAGAGVVWHLRTSSPPVQSVSSAPVMHAAPEDPIATVASPADGADVSLPSPTVVRQPSNPKVLRPTRIAASPPAASPVESSGETAAALFASANRERRQARAAAAIALYDELQRRHPGSEEARVSHVSLGRLLLERGAWSDALSQLDQYLTTSPDGLLAPEALFGKAQALQALGRREEERNTWTRLLTRFADSVYAPHARRRIEELR